MTEKIVLNYKGVRKLLTKNINNQNLYAYQDTLYVEGQIRRVTEGLISKEDIENFNESTLINDSKFKLYEIDSRFLNINPLLLEEERLKEKLINNPYTYLEKHGEKGTVLLDTISSDDKIFGLYNVCYPKIKENGYGFVQLSIKDIKTLTSKSLKLGRSPNIFNLIVYIEGDFCKLAYYDIVTNNVIVILKLADCSLPMMNGFKNRITNDLKKKEYYHFLKNIVSVEKSVYNNIRLIIMINNEKKKISYTLDNGFEIENN